FQVDAFTNRPFAGNPAAVCLLEEPADAVWMQQVAREMNLSETAFLVKQGDIYNLRWFTPAVEVDLCGHATLASAHILWEQGYLPQGQQARFSTKSGVLTAEQQEDWIELDFPGKPEESVAEIPGLQDALGVMPVYMGMSQFDCLVEVESEDIVRQIEPDLSRLAAIPVRGVIVTSKASTPGYDFVSRFFGPRVGVPEDPVTGSAHCVLSPFWSKRLGRTELVGYQASPRGGVVRVRQLGDRVRLGGQAVTVLRGELGV
ncbi:MAG TPA: PhzF family phenazine biosynthesis protein, partial [Ktedonobacteraceae bacterium]|nr:PhzF family phenazine biosynthesis protein [Ktedonobacteraceae bacterium]